MRRREFIAGFGAAVATTAPIGAVAQQSLPVIGYLSSFGQNDRPKLAESFRRGLNVRRVTLMADMVVAAARCPL